MKKVLVFAGTTEGRLIAEYLNQSPYEAYISVATEYGQTLLENLNQVQILNGRMDQEEIKRFVLEKEIQLIIDATHPFAKIVTENIKNVCEKTGVSYLRCVRDFSSNMENFEECVCQVDSIQEAVDYLQNTEGNILIATGSKELEEYTKLSDYTSRCYARVLSAKESIEKTISLGFQGEHLIAMQGPFSRALNVAMLQAVNASYFVTKESGKTGGFDEKLEAAREAGVTLVVIGRPQEEGLRVSEVIKYMESQSNVK